LHGAVSFWRTVGNVFNNKSVKEEHELHDAGHSIRDKDVVDQMFADHFDGKITKLLKQTRQVHQDSTWTDELPVPHCRRNPESSQS
jgi:hypothetical protein